MQQDNQADGETATTAGEPRHGDQQAVYCPLVEHHGASGLRHDLQWRDKLEGLLWGVVSGSCAGRLVLLLWPDALVR